MVSLFPSILASSHILEAIFSFPTGEASYHMEQRHISVAKTFLGQRWKISFSKANGGSLGQEVSQYNGPLCFGIWHYFVFLIKVCSRYIMCSSLSLMTYETGISAVLHHLEYKIFYQRCFLKFFSGLFTPNTPVFQSFFSTRDDFSMIDMSSNTILMKLAKHTSHSALDVHRKFWDEYLA